MTNVIVSLHSSDTPVTTVIPTKRSLSDTWNLLADTGPGSKTEFLDDFDVNVDIDYSTDPDILIDVEDASQEDYENIVEGLRFVLA